MNTNVLAFVPAYVELVDGDIQAALLFSQIIYWLLPGKSGKSKLRVERDGAMWLAKTASHWGDELGFTPKQAYRAIGVLKAKGLIWTKRFRFKGSPTTCIRLTEKGEDALNSHPSQFHSTSKANPISLQGKTYTEDYKTESTTENVDSAGKPAEEAQQHKNNKEQTGKEVEKISSKNENVSHYKSQELKLAKIWKEGMAQHHPGFQKELTKKEYGQLKQFREKVGQQAEEVLAFSIELWNTPATLKTRTSRKKLMRTVLLSNGATLLLLLFGKLRVAPTPVL